MKVGTDGVLLGAWADVEGATTALDIGTGSGLIALMLAQRNATLRVWGIDIDTAAVEQAKENAERSPWADRIEVLQADFCHVARSQTFSLIVSNPPFHAEDTPNPDQARNAARHTSALPIPVLMRNAAALLEGQGRFCLIVPTTLAAEVIGEGAANHLYLSRRTDVKTTPAKPAKRSLLEFRLYASPTEHSVLHLQDDHGGRSEAYSALTEAFYL